MQARNKMRPQFKELNGGLFSSMEKADVGDNVTHILNAGGSLMCWADPFYPDLVVPQKVQQRARDVLEKGISTHYTMPVGNPKLKKAIAARIKRKYRIDLDPERNIIINPGSDIGLMFAMTPFICPGDEILVHDPSYPSNFLNPELLGGVTVRVPSKEENNYRLNIDEYKKRLTSKTKMVLISSPNNPNGRVYSLEELKSLADFIVQNDLICVCDQAFEDTVFPGYQMIPIASLPGMWERTLTVCSVSKGMALSGYRIGFTYASDTIMDILYGCAVNIQGATSTLAQEAVIPAFEDDSFIQQYTAKHYERYQYAYRLFNSIPGIYMNKMESGFFSWINVSKLGFSNEIVSFLAEKAKVLCNDGAYYGDQGKGHIRIVHGVYEDNKKSYSALNRIADALQILAVDKGIK